MKPMMLLAGAMACMLSSALFAQTAAEGVKVANPYVRAVPPGQQNSASFMAVTNGSGSDHALVAAESPAAKVVELHTHTMVNGMMQMRQVPKIDLPAGKTVTLQPGGLHVMFIGLERNLIPGETVDLTLVYEDGSKQHVTAPIRKLQMKMMKKGMKMMH